MTTGIPTHNLTTEVRSFFKKELNVDIKTTDEAIKNENVQKYFT
jgi:hypothetical protein